MSTPNVTPLRRHHEFPHMPLPISQLNSRLLDAMIAAERAGLEPAHIAAIVTAGAEVYLHDITCQDPGCGCGPANRKPLLPPPE